MRVGAFYSLNPENSDVQAIIDGASRGDPHCRHIYVCFAGYLIRLLTAYLVQIWAAIEHLQILDFVRFEHLWVFGNGAAWRRPALFAHANQACSLGP